MEALVVSLGGVGVVILIIVLLVIFAPLKEIFLYWRSVKSRRTYVCPECKASYTLEHMRASNCSACGAPLVEQLAGREQYRISSEELPVSIEDRPQAGHVNQSLPTMEERDGTET